MKSKTASRLLVALILAAVTFFSGGISRAQQTSQPTSGQVTSGDDRDKATTTDNKAAPDDKTKDKSQSSDSSKTAAAAAPQADPGPYTFVSSIELGGRGVSVNGNQDKYRSDLNYQPGFRVFDASLMMKSNGNGGGPLLFDQLLVNTFGWSNDPNRYLRVNAEKAKYFKFDASYRRMDYFNLLNNIAAPTGISQHTADTEYRQGDFDLTLFPVNERFRLNLGYSLNRNSGPAVFTTRFSSDEFPVLMPVRTASDDYRIGFDTKLWIFDISFMQGWRIYKEDTIFFVDQTQIGNNKTNTSVINTFQRDFPTRGETPYTRFSLHTFINKRLDFTGRFIYSGADTNYTMSELLTGTDKDNNKIRADAVNVIGNAQRPFGTGDLAATFFVNDRIRISDTFRVQSFRITGGDRFSEVILKTNQAGTPIAVPPTNTLGFSFTNYRRYLNTIEGDVDLTSYFSFHLGYRYTNRHVELRPQDVTVGQPAPASEFEEFDSNTNSFFVGFKAKPLKQWSVYFDAEHGENDNVFTRTAPYDFTGFRIRNVIRPTKELTLNVSLTTRDNTNPTQSDTGRPFGTDINTRIFSSSVDWTPNSGKANITGGYTLFHIDSKADIIYFVSNNVAVSAVARYFTNDNQAFVTGYLEPHPRVRVYGAYRIHYDRGQGDRVAIPTVLVSSFPYQFESPEIKVSVKLHRNVDWIAGYQYFDYKERFVNKQFYQAHLPYSSLRIYFSKGE